MMNLTGFLFFSKDDETLPRGIGVSCENPNITQSRQSDVIAAQVFSVYIYFSVFKM